jgi:hypothetical protein
MAKVWRRLAMTKTRWIAAALIMMGIAGAAFADDAFSVGAVVKPVAGDPDPVCLERADAVAYHSANDACAFGSAGDCDAAKALETSGKCGAHHDAYTVLYVDRSAGVMRVSPQHDVSVSYWAFADDFSLLTGQ